MKKIFLFLAFLVCSLPGVSFAVACVSNGSGGWNVAGTWLCGGAPAVPTAADTVSIGAGHTVTIDGNATAGAAPASNTTYNIDISGTLYWPNTPGADWTFTAVSSIRINAGGILQIADSGTPLNSANRAYFYFDNTPANQKYKIYVNGGKLYVYGNPAYLVSSGTNYRARISSCNPDCNAGAGRTITLDRNVNWAASASATHDAVIIGSGGSATAYPAAGDDPEVITTWTSPAANQIGNVTLVENHVVGDLVANASRNVLFQSDSATYHSYIESTATNDPYDINWTRLDEFGDTNFAPGASISFNSSNHTVGTLDYISVTNAEDGGPVACFYLTSRGWTSFDGNVCSDNSSGSAFAFTAATFLETPYDVSNCSYFGSTGGNGYGFNASGLSMKINISGLWSSHANYSVYSSHSPVNITDSISHHTAVYGIFAGRGNANFSNITINITGNEVRNCTGSCIYLAGAMHHIANNDIDGSTIYCISISETSNVRAYSNTYDRCDTSDSANGAALNFASPNGYYYGYDEKFGVTSNNYKSNIMFNPGSYGAGPTKRFRGVCNNCVLSTPTNNTTCGVMDTDGIYQYSCSAGDPYRLYIEDDCYFTLQNKDQSSGVHVGWGPGGMVIRGEYATVVDNTVNMKVQPGNATEYNYVKIGQVYARSGDTVTVKLSLRKDESQGANYRPRLALDGSGFDREVDYDTMSDAINTWEEQQVSGVATYSGSVEIYVAVKNNLSGADAHTPVWPPTLEIYADGLSITSSP